MVLTVRPPRMGRNRAPVQRSITAATRTRSIGAPLTGTRGTNFVHINSSAVNSANNIDVMARPPPVPPLAMAASGDDMK